MLPLFIGITTHFDKFHFVENTKSSTIKGFLITTSKTLEILVPSLTKIFKDNGELTPRSLGATKVFEDE
jgi:hypothetical protein